MVSYISLSLTVVNLKRSCTIEISFQVCPKIGWRQNEQGTSSFFANFLFPLGHICDDISKYSLYLYGAAEIKMAKNEV